MRNVITFSTIIAAATAAHACDLCGCKFIRHTWDPRTGFTIGASEQFTRMGTMQEDGHEIDNDARQKLDSSITQIYLGYQITPRFGVQVNTPFIRRTFRRTTESGIEEGSIGGIGDVSIAANWLAIDHRTRDFTAQLQLSAGLKLPTGDSDRVKEEGAEGHHHGGEEAADHIEEESEHEAGSNEAHAELTRFGRRHDGVDHGSEAESAEEAHESEAEDAGSDLPESGIHGHDLALGTGSWDGIFGASVHLRWKRIFFTGDVQYALRGNGKHSYDYADDFQWSGGPGVTLIEKESNTLSIQFVCSGETKGEDRFRGQRADDTSITQVFLGPKFSGTWRDRFSADLALDIPVHQANSGIQIVPDYRLRASLSWMF